jgi:glycerol uptake facilitator-like aquaporin
MAERLKRSGLVGVLSAEFAKVAPYALAQTASTFVAALLVRWNYTEALAKADPRHTIKTQGVFSTLPPTAIRTCRSATEGRLP